MHLKETKQGRKILFGISSDVKWGLIFGYAATIFVSGIDSVYHYLIFGLYLALSFRVFKRLYSKELYLPRISVSVVVIFLLVLLVQSLFYLFAPLDKFLWLLIMDKLTFFLVAFFVAISLIFFDFNSDILINKAVQKLRNKKNLLTIAVVGSFGKGSTKEFISRVLASKYKVFENSASFDDALGIAKTVLKRFGPEKQIFIAELEDSKPGDIFEMTSMINPKITVMTGINDQKISMFGSIEKIIDSKFEAIETLPRDGIALFNTTNAYAAKLYDKTKHKKFSYGSSQKDGKTDIQAFSVEVKKLSLSFSFRTLGRTYKVSNVKLLGKHNVENLLPALFIGIYVGIDFSTIRKSLSQIKPLSKTMEPKKATTGAILVDDTHNININSVRKSLDYMKVYEGKKILVLEPLLELGKNANIDHFEMGEQIGKTCDFLFLTNDNYLEAISEGIKKSDSLCLISVQTPARIAEFIKKETKNGDVVVFEGKEAYNALGLLKTTSPY